eukprot:scaffold80626_cov67-Phaeocystis_antarctica.AAC.1
MVVESRSPCASSATGPLAPSKLTFSSLFRNFSPTDSASCPCAASSSAAFMARAIAATPSKRLVSNS